MERPQRIKPKYSGYQTVLPKSECFRACAAVTYGFSGGRLGDNLLSYLHAKWISYKHRIPLLYKPFSYSERLMLHKLELRYFNAVERDYQRHIIFKRGDPLLIDLLSSTLYEIPYFPESIQEYQRPHKYFYFSVDWDDPGFKAEIRKCLAPRSQLKLPKLPKGRMTIAVHVRRNSGGYDLPLSFEARKKASGRLYADDVLPFKHPPDDYYIRQIVFLADLLGPQPLYVFIFTDDTRPQQIVKKYQEAIHHPDILFDCRVRANSSTANVLNDFFAMTQFDCLIRPDSNLSIVASKLASYKVMISPSRCRRKGKRITIDGVSLHIDGKRVR